MKQTLLTASFLAALLFSGCGSEQTQDEGQATATTEATSTETVGQSGVQDETSNPNIVQVAVGSKDHSTLVAALKAAELVDALSNAGPFTVFAPTNAAFDKVPKETLDNLLKPENKDQLGDVLGYHTFVGSVKADMLQDGMELDQVALGKIKISQKDGKFFVNGNSEIVGSINTSNGVIHVVTEVLMPPK
jgi:uncharacterized surface protein with fasciclin (FAS1) repeats